MNKFFISFAFLISSISLFSQCDFTTSPTLASNSGCFLAIEDVVFTSLTNVTAAGNSITKVAGGTNWNAEGISTAVVYDNGYMEIIVTETNRRRMIGLSNSNTNSNWNTIQYAFYLNNTTLEIRESGSGNRISGGTVATNDTLRISVEDGVVNYYKNGTLLYISNNAPTMPLLIDNSINQTGGTFSNVVIANICDGNFTAYSTAPGTTPTYTWKVNGFTVQTGASNTYINTGLSVSDIVTCELLPGGVGACSGVLEISNNILIENISNYNIGEFYIEGTVVGTACNFAEEKVVWINSSLNNVDATTDSLYKIQSNGNWDGGAASWNTVSNEGYMQFIVTEVNKQRMIGFSNTNTNDNWNTIQYAFYLNNTTLEIRESGSGNRITGGTVASGDTLKIAVEAGVVNYYQNSTLLYISAIAPSLPLLVDASIKETGGTFSNVVVGNYNTGDFTANATNAGATPTYTWKVNGLTVQTGTSSTYTNSSLADNDILTCELTPNHNGCTSLTFASNEITNKQIDYPLSIDFYIEGTVATSACNTVEEYVAWKITDLNNVDATADSLYKIQSNGNWDGGAASWNTVSNEGYMQFIVTEVNKLRMIGLSNTNTNNNWNTIQYAFYLNNTTLEIRESGSGNRITGGSVASGDTLKIAVEAGVIHYYQNSTLLYISAIAPTLPLLVDASINQTGGTFSNVVVSNYNTGDFTATATNAGGSPSYQWVLNGVNVGSNSPNYTNTNLNDGDSLICILTPSISGCSTNTYNSNIIINREVNDPTSIDFHIRGTSTAAACLEAIEDVAWAPSSISNLSTSENSLTKIQSNGNWDGGAASSNIVNNEGYMEFTVSEVTTQRMIGLSNTNTNTNWNTIQYAFYLNNATLEIRESGSGNRITGGTVTPGDVLRISIEANTVIYYQNNTLLYTSVIAPSLPMIVDVSIKTINGTIDNVIIANNTNAGSFAAYASGAGANPTYNWKVNGVSMQNSTSSTYTNSSLNTGDVVDCELTPDIIGCSNATYESNDINIIGPGVSVVWNGVTDSDWSTPTNWTPNGIPDQYSIVSIPNGTPNSPIISANVETYDLEIGAGSTLTISGTNKLTIYRNFDNQGGTFNANNSIVEFLGCSNTNEINSTGTISFYDVELNNSHGMTISTGSVEIRNSFTFTDGMVFQNATFTFLDGATWSGANSSQFIQGELIKIGNQAFTFPIGKNDTTYAPISISAPSISTDEFTAEYFQINPDSVTPIPYSRNSKDLSIDYISACEYWILNHTNGSSSVNVTLSWNERSCGVTNLSELVVTRWDGSTWKDHGNGGTTGNTTTGTIITSAPVSSFSPFTLASTTNANPLPIVLTSFIAKENYKNHSVVLSWITQTEINNDFFTIERSADGFNWEEVKRLKGAGNSNTSITYNEVDEVPLSGISYYRLKQTDFNGDFSYSAIQTVSFNSENEIAIYPNPVNDVLTIKNLCGNCLINIYNSNGQLIYTGTNSSINTSLWNNGLYNVVVINEKGIKHSERIIK